MGWRSLLKIGTNTTAKTAGKTAAKTVGKAAPKSMPLWKKALWAGGIGLAGYGGYRVYQELFTSPDSGGEFVDPGETPYQDSIFDQPDTYQAQPQMIADPVYPAGRQNPYPKFGQNNYQQYTLSMGMQPNNQWSSMGDMFGFEDIY